MASVEPTGVAAAPLASAPASEAASSVGAATREALLELDARYYDARGSRPHAVRVSVDAARRVRVTGDGIDRENAASELSITAPILGEALEAVVFPDGGKLEVLDARGVSRLRELSGRPVPFARVYRWEQSWAWASLAVVLVAGLIVAAYSWVIPWGALRVARASPVLAQKVGQGAFSLIDLMLEPSQLQPAERERLRRVFELAVADFPGLQFRLEFRHAGVANAFALPDGTVVLTDELVKLSTDDDAVLGVFFHELGHVARGHGLRRVLESSAVGVIAMTYLGDASQLTAVVAGLPLLYAKSRYSRAEETEADDMALEGLLRHHKDPVHMSRLLRALEHDAGPAPSERKYFSSHPATEERAERFERASSGGG